MMQKTILILTLVLSCLSVANGQNLNCAEFHNGKFKLVDKENKLEFSIIRDNNIQTETNLKTGEVSKFKFEWVGDCICYLTMIEGKEEMLKFYSSRKLIVEIVEIYKDGYKFSAQIEGYDQRRFQTIKKVK